LKHKVLIFSSPEPEAACKTYRKCSSRGPEEVLYLFEIIINSRCLKCTLASSWPRQCGSQQVLLLFRAIRLPTFFICFMLSGEAANTKFIVFNLTRSGLEPMFHHTRDKHTNHYTTNAVLML
jgi:hypothetical protein